MKKFGLFGLIVLVCIGLVVAFFSISADYSIFKTASDIKQEARQASVQPMFDVPVFKVTFTTPLEEEKAISKEEITKLVNDQIKAREEMKKELANKIQEAIKDEREFQNKNRYKSHLTDIDVWGVLPVGKDKIILGALVPEWGKFPETILVVYKTEKTEVRSYDLEHGKDVLTISELANVSPSVAKEIVSKLRLGGYSVIKERMDITSEAKLLWFSDGWRGGKFVELNWSVTAEGIDGNLIVNYDPRGILEIRPIPKDKRVRVVVGYHDLLDEFKPKADELKRKEKVIRGLEDKLNLKEKEWQEEINRLREDLEKATKKEKDKRDISTVTTNDLIYGRVKLERLWYRTAASGIFLGNSKVRSDMSGFQAWTVDIHALYGEEKAFILTNAHVATMAISFEVYVSRDKETMWIILPAFASIRHTQDSDMHGSPAQLLAIDDRPVYSWDYDCAIMVTSKVPEYNHTVKLGDSDKVKEGDRVTMVGNPSMLQKFLTEGSVANTNYSLMKSHLVDYYLSKGISRGLYNWLLNTNFWFDAPIGVGGTSGSGVWAMSGSEKGKVIALHHAGLTKPTVFASDIAQKREINKSRFKVLGDGLISDVSKEEWKKLLLGFSREYAKFNLGFEEFVKENPSFLDFIQEHGRQDVAGLNAGIKINNIKRFLQERGLNPKEFGWEPAERSYWGK